MDPYKNPKWQKKRLEVLSRDDWKCVACGNSEATLHVHHLFYDGAVWETPSQYLQTLCETCHKSLGAHPKGGVYFILNTTGDRKHATVKVDWCPVCSCQTFRTVSDDYAKCTLCTWDTVGYDNCLFGGNIKWASEPIAKKPKPYSLKWLKTMMNKIRESGTSDVDLFHAMFPESPAAAAAFENMCAIKAANEQINHGHLSVDQEEKIACSVIRARREIERLLVN